MKRLIASIGTAIAFIMPMVAAAITLPPNDGFVTDAIPLLSPEEEQALEADLTKYQQETSNEIAVVIIPTMSGADITDTAIQLHRRWGVGDPEKDNGILMLIAYKEREAFISVGTGLEGAVPDVVTFGIGEQVMAPLFRDGEYGAGIAAGIDALKNHIGGEYTADRYDTDINAPGILSWLLVFVFIGLQWMAALLGRSKSWWLGGIIGGVLGIVLTVMYSWWLSIPVMVIVGLIFDFIVSRMGYKGGGGGFWGGGMGGGGMSSRSSFKFGGGSTSGGGARFKW